MTRIISEVRSRGAIHASPSVTAMVVDKSSAQSVVSFASAFNERFSRLDYLILAPTRDERKSGGVLRLSNMLCFVAALKGRMVGEGGHQGRVVVVQRGMKLLEGGLWEMLTSAVLPHQTRDFDSDYESEISNVTAAITVHAFGRREAREGGRRIDMSQQETVVSVTLGKAAPTEVSHSMLQASGRKIDIACPCLHSNLSHEWLMQGVIDSLLFPSVPSATSPILRALLEPIA